MVCIQHISISRSKMFGPLAGGKAQKSRMQKPFTQIQETWQGRGILGAVHQVSLPEELFFGQGTSERLHEDPISGACSEERIPCVDSSNRDV